MGWAGLEVLLGIMLGVLLLGFLLTFQLKAHGRMKSVHLALVSPRAENRREKVKNANSLRQIQKCPKEAINLPRKRLQGSSQPSYQEAGDKGEYRQHPMAFIMYKP